jgi:hypothetical protein
MNYTLITSTGKVQTFFIKATAELYQSIYGGIVVTREVFQAEKRNPKLVEKHCQ